MNLITIYFKTCIIKEGPYTHKGTEYFKDKECTQPFFRDPYTSHYSDHIVKVNGFRYQAVKV